MGGLKCKYVFIFISVAVIIFLITLTALLVVFLRNSSSGTIAGGPKLIIDHDGGADDAMAIFMALLCDTYLDGPNVVALTTVHGNVDEGQVYINSQRILDIAGKRDVPIYRGSTTALVKGEESDYFFGKDGLGDNDTVEFEAIEAHREHAVYALIELSKKYEGELTVLAIGSLTNIALAIKLDRDFTSRLCQLFVAAGNVYSENHPEAEFNAKMDVEAYRIVTNHGYPEKTTIIPFSQIMDSVNISIEWRLNVLGAIPTDIMKAQNIFEQVSIPQEKSWVLLDPAAMAIVLNYNRIVEETKYSNNSIILCGGKRGVNTNVITSLPKATTRMVYAIVEDPYKMFLLDIFTAELKKPLITHRPSLCKIKF